MNTDIMSVLLKKSIFENVSSKELAQQIEGRKKCQKKLPTWFNTPNIYFPKKLNIEQTSSEITAQYKSDIVNGKSLVDLTGGFGIDSYFFSQKIDTIFHCEIDPELAKITTHNFTILRTENIKIQAQDSLAFLQETKHTFDWVYADPSRRNKTKGKVFVLADCIPNITEHLDFLFTKTENILLKTAPLLDISSGIASLKHVKEIHVVAILNEVKELLWVLNRDFDGEINIKTINITNTKKERFDFAYSEEKKGNSTFEQQQTYLYEPNAAILKAGAFKTIGNNYNLAKLNPNTHLYTSTNLIDWPGRRFKIVHSLEYNKKNIKKLAIKKANITVRNFPESVATIREKFKIKDGGDTYLFFFKNLREKKQILVCKKP